MPRAYLEQTERKTTEDEWSRYLTLFPFLHLYLRYRSILNAQNAAVYVCSFHPSSKTGVSVTLASILAAYSEKHLFTVGTS